MCKKSQKTYDLTVLSQLSFLLNRPFERTLTLHKDSAGQLGFQFKEGKITAIVVDSSAARNGVLIEHNLLEVTNLKLLPCIEFQMLHHY